MQLHTRQPHGLAPRHLAQPLPQPGHWRFAPLTQAQLRGRARQEHALRARQAAQWPEGLL